MVNYLPKYKKLICNFKHEQEQENKYVNKNVISEEKKIVMIKFI